MDGGGERGCSVHEGVHQLVQLLPRVARGLRRHQAGRAEARPELGPRHRPALAVVREAPTSVGGLAAVLDLNLATASSLVADLERVGFVERSVDPSDRRRTIVVVPTARRECVDRWLEGVTAPLARALGQLSPTERTTFLKAMRCLAAELNDVQEA